MKSKTLFLLLAAGPGIFSKAPAQIASTNPPAPARPSIVFVQCHGLGYGDLSCYGQQLFQTPNLDRLAAEGVRCTSYFAGNIGASPSPEVLMFGKNSNPAKGEPNFAQRLQQAGYHTGLIGEWALGDAPWTQGFDEFAGFIHDEEGRNYFSDFIWRYDPKGNIDWTNNVIRPWVGKEMIYANTGGQKGRYVPEILVNAACAFININHPDQFNGQRPFFLLLNLPEPRSAHAGGDDFTVTSDAPYSDEPWPQAAKNRAALLGHVDSSIARIAAQLATDRMTNNVLFIFASSAPPEKFANTNLNFLQPNGTAITAKDRAAAPLPLILRWPGTIPPAQINTNEISAADIAPTLLETAVGKVPETFSGQSLLPALTGISQPNQSAAPQK